MDPTGLQVDLDQVPDQDGVLAWELLGLKKSEMPSLDPGTERRTARSRLALEFQLPFQRSPAQFVDPGREDLEGLDPGQAVLRTGRGLGACWAMLRPEGGSSSSRTQNSPEWKPGQGSALLDPDPDQDPDGVKVVQEANRQEQGQEGGAPENLPGTVPKRFHSPGVVLRLDRDQGCAWKTFWISPGWGGTWDCQGG